MFFIVTGNSLIPKTQEPSQGAGHTRPVNSVKRTNKNGRFSNAENLLIITRIDNGSTLINYSPGKLFVCRSWFKASLQLLLNTRSFHFGIILPRGQP